MKLSAIRNALLTGCCGLGLLAAGAQGPGWTVKPEWVKAHEDFLASDVLHGRGSATRDEELAASYVASEFVGYGLQTAPGMTGYMQSAGVQSPMLDGRAGLQDGAVHLAEGPDFTLLQASGVSESGPLLKLSAAAAKDVHPARGSIVLITDVPGNQTAMQVAYGLRRNGVAAVLMPEDEATNQAYTMYGGRTRVPVQLADQPARTGAGFALVAMKAGALEVLRQLPDGSTVSLNVHAITAAGERQTYNAVGFLPGTDPASGTILLSAHLDHLGVGRPVNGDAIYNGANDDASGTTAVLELAHALSSGPRLKRNVLFVCYGSEEIGELGSTYFGEHPPVPLKSIVANLEFEMIGNQDPKMPPDVLLLTGWDRTDLGPELKAHGALLGPDPYPEQHFFQRSDNYALALKGVIAQTAAGWGTVPTYHHPDDDLAHLNLPFMTAAIQSLVEPMRWLADSDFVPRWKPGGQPRGRN